MDQYVSDQLQQLIEKNQKKATMGPNEATQASITELYNEYLQAKETAESAPSDLAEAERAYYTALDGGSMYQAKLKGDAKRAQPEIMHAFDARMDRLDDQILTMQTMVGTAENVDTTMLKNLNKMVETISTSDVYKDAIAVNLRKTYYLDERETYIATWSLRITLMFIVMAAVEFGLAAREKDKSRVSKGLFALVCWGVSYLFYWWFYSAYETYTQYQYIYDGITLLTVIKYLVIPTVILMIIILWP
jgi:hypothetical protein